MAEAYGARPIDPALGASGRQIHDLTHGRGVDMALEFAGIPATQAQAVASLAVQSYPTLINRQAEIVRVSDHLRGELITLMEIARRYRVE